MNILAESTYVLHILWGYVKCLVNKYNLKYLLMPIMYLFIILFINSNDIYITNEVVYVSLDTYTTVLSRDDKIESILERYNLSENEFKVLCAIVLTEADKNSYEDTYAVINTIYNRTHSKSWVKTINNQFGNNKGRSLYYQAIAPRQFVVYEHGSYKKNLNNTTSIGYDAIIDFLYTEDVMHNYLSFRANNIKVKNSETFSEKGNNYFNVLIDSNRI